MILQRCAAVKVEAEAQKAAAAPKAAEASQRHAPTDTSSVSRRASRNAKAVNYTTGLATTGRSFFRKSCQMILTLWIVVNASLERRGLQSAWPTGRKCRRPSRLLELRALEGLEGLKGPKKLAREGLARALAQRMRLELEGQALALAMRLRLHLRRMHSRQTLAAAHLHLKLATLIYI